MKKFLVIFCMVLMLISVMPFSYAVAAGKISVTDVFAEPGKTVSVDVKISNNPGVIAMRLFVSYDSSKITLVSADDAGIFGLNNSAFNNDINANPYVLLWEDALASKNHTSNGTLAKLKFRVKDSFKSGKTDIKLTLDTSSTFDINLSEVAFSVSGGSISVKDNSPSETQPTNSTQNITQTRPPSTGVLPTSGTEKNTSTDWKKCDHNKLQWIVVDEASCLYEGKKKQSCADCGLVLRVEPLPKTEHKMTNWIDMDSDDESVRKETRECSVCRYGEIRLISPDGTVLSVESFTSNMTTPTAENTDPVFDETSENLVEEDKYESDESADDLAGTKKIMVPVLVVLALLCVVALIVFILLKFKRRDV